MVEQVYKDVYCVDVFYGAPRHGAVYIVRDNNEVAIIDTGTALSKPFIMQALQKLNIAPEQVRYLLPSHVHLDHAGGASPLSQVMPNASVIVHPRGLRHLIDPSKLIEGSYQVYGEKMMREVIGKIEPLDAKKGLAAEDNMRLPLGKRYLQLLFSPGHAKHHYSVWDETSACYFAGDVGGNSYSEMDANGQHLMFLCSAPVQYDPLAWDASLRQIQEIKPKFLCLCHYGVIKEDGAQQAVQDLRRLIQENNEAVLRCPAATREEVAKAVWTMFWQEYERISPPMSRAEARQWMEKDVYIATGGLLHWLKQRQAENDH